MLIVADEDEKYWNENVRNPAMSWLAHGSRGAPRSREETVAEIAVSGGAAALLPETSLPRRSVMMADSKNRAWGQGASKTAQSRRTSRESSAQSSRWTGKKGKGGSKGKPDRSKKGSGKKGRTITTDAEHKPLCFAFNDGNPPCGGSAKGATCPKGMVHRCTVCRGDHASHEGCA